MAGITRRSFIKMTTGAMAGGFVFPKFLGLKWLCYADSNNDFPKEKFIPTMCHGCSFGGYNCGLIAHVKNEVFYKVEGNRFCPLNEGRVCAKGQSAVQWVYNPHRLKYPLKRIGKKGEGRFKRISWDEAITTISEKIKEVKKSLGPEYILMVKGQASGWYNLYHKLLVRFLHAIGSPNFSWWGPFVCFVPQLFYHLITIGGNPISSYAKADYENADLIIEWFTSGGQGGAARGGEETINTNLRSVPIKILKRLEQGAKLIVINPQFIPLAANGRAYKWIPVKPGTDSALALAMLHVIIKEQLYDKEFVEKWCDGFEKLKSHVNKYTPQWAENITGISKKEIIELARLYATTEKACIRFSESPEKADLQAFAMAIAMLIAITGHLDRAGGNVYFYPTVPLRLDTFDNRLSKEVLNKTLGHDVFWINVMGGPTQAGADFISVIEALVSGKPYRPKVGLFFCTNPLSTARNPEKIAEAIKQLELCVVVDVVATPTTRYADIILPAATRYESPGDIGIWENHLGFSSQVIKPLWETKPDFQIILDLAGALGMGKDFWNGNCDKMLEDFLQSTLKPLQKQISLKELKKKALKGVYLPVTDRMKKRERYKEHFSILPNHKVQLYNEFLKKHGYDPLPTYHGEPEDPITTPELLKEYPLMFTDEHAMYLNHHSWMRNVAWLREIRKHNYVKIHPDTARKYGIKDGDWIEIISPHGSMKAVAWLFSGIRPDTLIGQHGWWQGCSLLKLPETSVFNRGTNVNVLYNWDKRDPITQNITKNTLVKIRKSSPPEPISPIKIKEKV